MSARLAVLLWSWIGLAGVSHAACVVRDSAGRPAAAQRDALYVLLSTAGGCPENARDLKSLLQSAGLTVQPALVANRGRHNPEAGSFSLFEQAQGNVTGLGDVGEGEFFFGHFTDRQGNDIVLDQTPRPGKLLVELIAWDYRKQLFNFYELIGTATGGRWFYRGDSADALADNVYLYRTPPAGAAKFGNRMRCSACHTSGGPILKELQAPHNDWWTTERPLPFGSARPSTELERWLRDTMDAATFASAVSRGMDKLEKSPAYRSVKAARSLPEQLRPLFCETEINLESDSTPHDVGSPKVRVPSASIVSPLLAEAVVEVDRAAYLSVLREREMAFPETGAPDADHAWLTPVKAAADLAAIRTLVETGIADDELVADVLAVDMQTPLLSSKRCGLLAAVPEVASGDWRQSFEAALAGMGTPASKELLTNLRDEKRSRAEHRSKAMALLNGTRDRLATLEGLRSAVSRLVRDRKAVSEAELSKNPRGQILEPGFRVIFPVPGA